MRLLPLLGLLLAPLLAGMDAAPDWTLLDGEGRPLAHARVVVHGRSGGVRTDESGRFALRPLPPPPFQLVVFDETGAFRGTFVVEEAPSTPEARVLRLIEQSIAVAPEEGIAPETPAPPASAATRVGRQALDDERPARLADVLRSMPGASVTEGGASAVPSLRGLPRGRTLILLDDARVTSERRAGPSATYVDPFALSSLEVVRGPGSVLYGSDAIGGVLHGRTPIPSLEATTGRFVTEAGSFGAFAGGAEVSVPVGTGAVLLQGHARQVDDYDAPGGTVFDTASRAQGGLVRYAVPVGPARLNAGYQVDRGDDIGKPSLAWPADRAYYPEETSERFTLGLDLPHLAGFDEIAVRAFYGRYALITDRVRLNRDASDAFDGTARVNRSDLDAHDGSLRAMGTRKLGQGTLRTGVDLSGRFGLRAFGFAYARDVAQQDTLTGYEVSIDSADRTMAGLFVETEQPLPWVRWSVAGGLRGDRVRSVNEGGYFGDRDISHGAMSGFAAVTFVPAGSWSTTLQVSRGFRDATLSDRFFRGVSGRGFITGNPDLSPETTLQWDLAVRRETPRFGVAVYGYAYELEDLIERYRPAGSDDFAFRNAGTEQLYGVELESEAVLPGGLVVRGTLAWSRGEIEEDGSPAPDVTAPSAGLALERRTGAWRGWVQWSVFLRDDRPRTEEYGGTEAVVPGYGLLDASLGRALGKRFEARVIGRNLTDHSYPGGSDEIDAPAAGRSATLALSGKW